MEVAFWLPILIAFSAALVAAVTDVWKFRVYNVLTIPLFLTGLVYHVVFSGWSGLGSSFLGALFGFGSLIVPYLLGLMGAGDVKLMAGVGAWLGMPVTLFVFVVSSLVAGLYATALILIRGKVGESLLIMRLIFYRFAALGMHFGKEDLVEQLSLGADRRLRVIPFGAMVPIGIVGALLWVYWFN
jgi:prepilin peptidase CpaA